MLRCARAGVTQVTEKDLAEIENRLESYPPQARHDILRLTGELRRLSGAAESHADSGITVLHDPVTGLLNGGAYGVRFAMARARATRYKKLFAVMSIDVAFDGERSAGKPLSDEDRELTIRHVAERLESCVRETDTLARIGDENFAVILEDLGQPDHAERVQQIVRDALTVPVELGGEKVVPETRVDMDFYPSPRHGEGERVYN